MSKISCIVVEDEPLAARILVDYISQVPYLHLEGIFKDAILATNFLRNYQPDLIFLDIHLPKLKGMAFLKTLTYQPAVIITTAYHDYAVEGFELNVTDYLLKPFAFERFLVAVNKIKAAGKDIHPVNDNSNNDHLFLSVQKKKVRILFCEILFIESQREYVKIRTTKGELISKLSTHELEAMLPANLFKRVHRSFIVALNKIDSYTSDEMVVGGIPIPIGRGYKEIIDHL